MLAVRTDDGTIYDLPSVTPDIDGDFFVSGGSSKVREVLLAGLPILDGPEELRAIESALDHVAGYTVSNDDANRPFQAEDSVGQCSKGKSCETFTPLVVLFGVPHPSGVSTAEWSVS